jgi:glycosyltransferase involved in cell wall biosynthesis
MTSLWIDLSTSREWQGTPVGIIRTEVMVAKELLAAGMPGLRFCHFDRSSGTYLEMSRAAAEDILQRMEIAAPGTGAARAPGPSALQACRATLERWALAGIGLLPRRLRGPLRAWIAAWLAVAGATVALLRALGPPRRASRRAGPPAAFACGDAYLSMGLDWDNNDLKVLGALRKSAGIRVFLLAYDLIPVYQPQFISPGYAHKFKDYFRDLLACVDVVFAISEDTTRQLERYAREIGAAMPASLVIRLGAKPPTGRSQGIPALVSRPFVLVVGTVEVRKNHRLLYQLWTKMRSDTCFPDPPDLVIAGRRGWRVDDLFAEMDENPAIRGVVHHLESPSDAELEWLYDKCLFTVFPSFSEGFGLPVVESLAHGKCCISSDTSSLPEAGQDLTQLLDPLDFAAWYDAIKALALNPTLRRDQEARIRDSFTMSSWKDTAETIRRTIEATGVARNAG